MKRLLAAVLTALLLSALPGLAQVSPVSALVQNTAANQVLYVVSYQQGVPVLGPSGLTIVGGVLLFNGTPIGAGGGATLGANTFTGVQTAPGFATSGATQGYLVLQQNGTAAPAQPANSYELLAPLSGLTSSYSNTVPLLAPTSANSVMASPSGGGQYTWQVPAFISVANTFTQPQSIQYAAGGVAQTYDGSTGTNAICNQYNGGGTGSVSVQFCAGGQGFAPGYFYTYSITAGYALSAISATSLWLNQNVALNFGNSSSIGSQDVGIFRATAGHLAVDNGTASNAAGYMDMNGIRSAGPGNTDLVGRLTLAGASGTYTLGDTYSTRPACFANDEATTPTLSSCVCTTTVCTIYGTTGHVIDFHTLGFN